MGKVRIYDLAKELKLESKKVLEDARRLGVDVSVPSNTLDDNIAAKIREMYYPKKDSVAVTRTARLIKHAMPPAGEASTTAPAPPTPVKSEPAPAPTPVSAPSTTQETAPSVTKTTIIKPLPPPPVEVAPPVQPPSQPQMASPAIKPAPTPQPGPTAEVVPPVETKAKPVSEPEPEKARIVKIPTPTTPLPVKTEAPPAATIESVAAELEVPATVAEKVTPIAKEEAAPVAAPVVVPDTAPLPTIVQAEPPAPTAPAITQIAEAKSGPAPAAPSGTKVIKLALPTKPLPPTPPPTKPLPKPAAGQQQRPTGPIRGQNQRPGTGKLEPDLLLKVQREGQPRDTRDKKEVHLLPSGAQQRTVYIPPQSQKPKGRNQHRPKEKEKFQEGNTQKLTPRKNAAPEAAKRALPEITKQVRLVEGSTVREFAEKIDAKPRDIVAALMQRGVMATINQVIDPTLAKDIARDYGIELSFGEFEEMIVETEFEITPEAMDDTDLRAPVVTVMGHVDHGKTSLLDAIRSTRVAEGEAGGITQHIGAYSVEVVNPDNPEDIRRVVFLDTPGHEAFTMMRARGARVTDIVVLVVAADDGVMPQTVEAIEHAKAAKVPIIVAINKIDKPDANPDRVRKELADRGLLWSNWGGDIEMVEVSAKKRQNINGLLEMLLLTADINDLKSNKMRKATGTVLEAKLDRGRGAVATVLIQNGTLHIGDPFIVGNFFGRVRALMNDRGERVQETGPAMPVEVLGLEGVPAAGDQFQVVDDITKAQQISSYRQGHARAAALARSAARGLDQLAAQMQSGEVKELLVILKADVQGSVEVLRDTLTKLSTEKVKVRIIRAGVGAITYDDVLLASASQATDTGAATVIIGFNVRPEARAEDIAKQESVDIRLHSIIYKVEEEIRNAMLGLMDATMKEVVLGKAEVRDIIRVPKVGSVAGCMVLNGSIKRTAQARLIRDNVVIFETHIGSLRRFKEDVSDVQQGYECGITIERFNDYKIGDVIEAFVTEKVVPTQL